MSVKQTAETDSDGAASASKPKPRRDVASSSRPRPGSGSAPESVEKSAAASKVSALRDRVGRSIALVAGSAVIFLAAAILLGVFYLNAKGTANDRLDSLRAQRADTKQVLVAAETLAVDISTYDYRNLDTNFDRVASQLMPKFAAEYKKTSGALRATITQYKAIATAKALDAGVVSVSASKAVVIVFLDQTVTNTQSKLPTVSRNRVEVKLARSGKRWTVSSLSLK